MVRQARLLLGSTVVVLVAARAGAVDLLLESTKHRYQPGESVIVRVLVRNPPDSEQVWYLKRAFWLVPYSRPRDGDLGLVIRVVAPNGTLLSPKPGFMMVCGGRTEPSQFEALRPGEVFGQEFALHGSGLEFEMKAPGAYRVSAELFAASPREWFDEWLRSGGQPSPSFKREDLFVGSVLGSIYSAPLEVQIGE